MLLTIAISFVLLALSHAENEKENVYYYEGYVSFDAADPTYYTSYTMIGADLHVLKHKNDEYWMCLKNVKFQAFSGSNDLDQTDDTTFWQPIPKESEAITLPFISNVYSKKSKNGITTSKDDLPWSRNIKKAIADLFYVDKKAFEGKTQSFRSENGFDYYVFNSEKNLNITKMMSGDMFENHFEETNEDKKLEDYFPLPIVRKFSYIIDPKTNDVKQIIALTNLEYKPLNGISEKFELLTNQTLVLKDKRDSEMTGMDQSNMVYSEVKFDMNAYLTKAGGLDLSKGRIEIDMDETVTKLVVDLEKTFTNLNKSHITLSKTTINDNENIESVIRRLKYLDEKHLHDIYLHVAKNEDLSEILLEMISFMGTPASCMFVVDMVAEKKFTGEEALDALSDIPVHAFILPVELKNKLIALTKGEYSDKIKRQAVLTLSNLVSKSVNKPGYEYTDVVENFIEELKSSKIEPDQLLYMYALRNIRSERTIDEMILIAQGAKGYNHLTTHTRAESLYRLDRTQKGEEALWMLFANKNEDFEIRAAAMNALVSPDRPKSIEKIFWLLNNADDDDEINHLFATKLNMLSSITMDRYEKISTRAAQLETFFDKPHITLSKSTSDILELFDDYVGVGSAFELTYYGNVVAHNFTSIQLQVTSKSSGPTTNTEEWHLYLENVGLSELSLEAITEKITDIGAELVSIDNGRVLSFRSYNWLEIVSILVEDDDDVDSKEVVESDDTEKVEKTSNFKNYLMGLDYSDEILIPTDMGIPAVFRNNAGFIAKFDVQFQQSLSGNVMFDLVYRGNEIYGFTSYNPISDTWTGIKRVMISDLKFPLNIDYKVNVDQKNLKLSLAKNEAPSGFQSFVYSQVYIRDASNGEILKKTCPKCELDNFISNGEDQLEGHVYLDEDIEDTGSHYKVAVFDCEQRVTASYLSITDFNQWWNLIMASPTPGMCGVGFMLEKSKKYPATHLEATIRLIDEDKEDYVSYEIVKVAYNVKNADKLVKSWNFNYLSAQPNHTYTSTKFSAKETKEGSPTYKFCFDMTDIWYRNYLTTSTEITAGNDDSDEKCPKGGSVINIETKGEQSEEMKTADLEGIFSTCDDDSTQSFSDCLREVTSYRHYTIDITHKNLTPGMDNLYRKASDLFREQYSSEFIRLHKQPEISENEIKIFVDFPLYYKTLNVTLMDHNEAYRYDDIEIDEDLSSLFFTPYSTFTEEKLDSYSYCEAGLDYVTDDPDGDNTELTFNSDGVVILAHWQNDKNETEYTIALEKSNKDSKVLGLLLENGEDKAELTFKDDFVLKINDKVVEITPNVTLPIHDSFDVLMTYRYEENHRVFVNLVGRGATVEYTRDRVRISLLNEYLGECKV